MQQRSALLAPMALPHPWPPQGLLPPDFCIVGYSRSKMSDAEFRSYIEGKLTCRIDKQAECASKMNEFLSRSV